jgi:hypothetical protein
MFHSRSAAHVRRDRSVRVRHLDSGLAYSNHRENVSDRLRARRAMRIALHTVEGCDCDDC